MSELEDPAAPAAELERDDQAAGDELAAAPVQAAGDAMLPWRYNERVLIVGTTRCGKSTLAHEIAAETLPRLLVIDPKGEGATVFGARSDTAQVEAWLESRPTAQDPGPRVCRWVPTSGEPAEYEPIYAAAHRHRGPLIVYTDELYSPGTAQTAPRSLKLYLTQGGGRNHGHIGLTQRPVNVCREAITEWTHLVIFAPPPDPADLRDLARGCGVPLGPLMTLLEQLPKHGFVWIERGNTVPIVCGPIPRNAGMIV